MNVVRPKKNLGQHFLKDRNIAFKIVDSLGANVSDVLEIGPGMGILTGYLMQRKDIRLYVVEVDPEAVRFLNNSFPELTPRLFNKDFLKWDLKPLPGRFCIIGNFPYNISSQIFFRLLALRNRVPEVVGMVQKEVADRLAAGPGSKTYGILSVLLQAWYEVDSLFSVPPGVFVPPPKVKSAVIRLKRNATGTLPCNEQLFFEVVKTAFNQRRKMLRNSLSGRNLQLPEYFAPKRPEQLTVADFIELTNSIENLTNGRSWK